jgi:hypothetical protein
MVPKGVPGFERLSTDDAGVRHVQVDLSVPLRLALLPKHLPTTEALVFSITASPHHLRYRSIEI